ncbi:phage protein ydab [Photorhabdus luminescens subsp. luminescens]|uniref:Phage tail fibre repeat-containing protein n=1 Tax=Photorhabdus luminescens TaxID=29488 RepID=A0A1G5R3P6_PHOLU|nr:phage tail protein [Photorhabdus luminescens]KMW72814.1 phage protein ydab [Photorhabdus luminescens subsp. luminescens]SCZ68478.1 Phage tail fibre repeat-containing protein [Photorhabdus luminescens]
MSHKNDFKAFSISNNANVISQEKYEENPGLQTGFSPENVPTHLLNKVLRQSSTISSVVADFIATRSGNDVLDDGNVAKLTAQLNKAIEQKITTDIPSASLTQKGVVQLTNVIGNSDTLAATQKLVQEVISSLREEINIPVGSPIPWPLLTPPFGYFVCNGSPFNKLQYPKLAEAYPSGRLPDLRGEFIRGWDDNRGVDGGRGLLSWQGDAIRNITGSTQAIHAQMGGAPQTPIVSGVMASSRYATADTRSANGGSSTDLTYFDIDASRQVPTANENRPRNVAFNYIVRAA